MVIPYVTAMDRSSELPKHRDKTEWESHGKRWVFWWFCPRHIPKLLLLEIGVPQKQCWIAIGSQIWKNVWHFFWEYLKTGVDSINLVSPLWLILWNTIELLFACVVIWGHLVFPHHVFHNCRICVQNFRRFFPWKIIVQSFFPYVLWFFHDFPMIFPLKSAPLVHTAPFWKKTAPASSLVATWTAILMGFHQRNLRKR